jgi:tubulin polyglutamylase TTLL5
MTRKDRLYKNVQKMQQEKGVKNFNFIPTTFLLPYEFEDFSSKLNLFILFFSNYFCLDAFQREKGFWIIKPVASSQGKGIFLINHVNYLSSHTNIFSSQIVISMSY